MSSLINRNIVVAGHRTSMRLEPEMWGALSEICEREKCSVRDICTLVDSNRGSSSLTSAVRVFILAYFRYAAANSNDGTLANPAQENGAGGLAPPHMPSGQPHLADEKTGQRFSPLVGQVLSHLASAS